jgi:Ion channel
MPVKTRDLMRRSWQSQANLFVFLCLLILLAFVIPSMGFEKHNLPLYEDMAFSVVSVVGAAIAWGNRRLFALTSLVAIVAIALRWATWWKPTHTLIIWSVSAGLAAILTITVVLLWQVFRSGPVTVMRIQGAIAAYLCLGFAWAHAYRIAELVDPGAFNTAGTDVSVAIHWINYSFGILTTIGYPSIVPIDSVAHTLCSAEAVTGQLYLAVLVARLVSMHVSAEEQSKQERSAGRQ